MFTRRSSSACGSAPSAAARPATLDRCRTPTPTAARRTRIADQGGERDERERSAIATDAGRVGEVEHGARW